MRVLLAHEVGCTHKERDDISNRGCQPDFKHAPEHHKDNKDVSNDIDDRSQYGCQVHTIVLPFYLQIRRNDPRERIERESEKTRLASSSFPAPIIEETMLRAPLATAEPMTSKNMVSGDMKPKTVTPLTPI